MTVLPRGALDSKGTDEPSWARIDVSTSPAEPSGGWTGSARQRPAGCVSASAKTISNCRGDLGPLVHRCGLLVRDDEGGEEDAGGDGGAADTACGDEPARGAGQGPAGAAAQGAGGGDGSADAQLGRRGRAGAEAGGGHRGAAGPHRRAAARGGNPTASRRPTIAAAWKCAARTSRPWPPTSRRSSIAWRRPSRRTRTSCSRPPRPSWMAATGRTRGASTVRSCSGFPQDPRAPQAQIGVGQALVSERKHMQGIPG